jgi:hypothetical protein
VVFDSYEFCLDKLKLMLKFKLKLKQAFDYELLAQREKFD